MAAQRVSLLIKFGSADHLIEARTLADSVLAAAQPTTQDEARRLSVIAAFAGRPHRAARWASLGAEPRTWPVTIPVAATSPAAVLEVYTAMGGPLDSIAAYERILEVVLNSRIPGPERQQARAALLTRAASLAYMDQPLECFQRLGRDSPYLLLRAQSAHAAGDLTEAIEVLARIRAERLEKGIRATNVSHDAVFPEAWLWAELGDTATAVAMLDANLNTLRWAEPGSVVDVSRAASLVRAMALRADLAAATDDDATARRWAAAVYTLWGNADPVLAPLSNRMLTTLEASPGGRPRAP
jgi:hypothetical protein